MGFEDGRGLKPVWLKASKMPLLYDIEKSAYNVFSENRTGFLYEGFENGRKAEAGSDPHGKMPLLFFILQAYICLFFSSFILPYNV